MRLPNWPPRDWRKLLALLFSIMGAVVLTLFVWWGSAALLPDQGWTTASEADRANTLRWVLWIAIGGIVVVLFGLGMAINRRTLQAKWGDKSVGFDGGENSDGDGTGTVSTEGAA
ncbi:alkaline shock response membrane anchor protein AmaP [Novosphingobium sp. FKTRR1]|uniref:alkaline shock response membrane anchor protein AmaP n=1 Tax=Novosphingobium sp. FKTRR1 TaxID=2879118 RepID=UPI001CF04A13|nr:alkaline shock response membrane anchor protein AmaP [Novosphingobium sp. FKTRR1]